MTAFTLRALFASQFLVRDAMPNNALYGFAESLTVAQPLIVEAIGLFIKITGERGHAILVKYIVGLISRPSLAHGRGSESAFDVFAASSFS